MSDLKVTVKGATEAVARVGRLSKEVRERGAQAVTRLTYALREEARKKYGESGLHVRTGALKSSIVALPIEREEHCITGKVVAGQKLRYARIQEYGGTIKPKKAKFLAIPLNAVKTAAGVARFSPREAAAAGYPHTFVRSGVLFGKQGDQVVPLFALRRSVTLPARPYMRPALEAMRPKIEEGIRAAVAAAANSGPVNQP